MDRNDITRRIFYIGDIKSLRLGNENNKTIEEVTIMRTEQEMMAMILNFARNDGRVRAVTMEGSRLNRNAPRDRFQDYDIAFLVTDVESYKAGDDWLAGFGRRVIMQKPEGMALFPPELGGRFTYLMLYEDGNRIDLSLIPLDEIDAYFSGAGSLTKVLLDKDGRCPALAEPSDKDYHVKKPSAEFIDDCCNEFWWLSTYVVKGLCRNEFLYAVHHFELMRNQLLTMISWKAGIDTGFTVSAGKSYKYLDKLISNALWDRILQTYRIDSTENLWQSLIRCCALFEEISKEAAAKLPCPYPQYAEKVLHYIQQFIPRQE
jgi:aminoglycoside 6-adenylyltransferase